MYEAGRRNCDDKARDSFMVECDLDMAEIGGDCLFDGSIGGGFYQYDSWREPLSR